ncbi:MAG: hypothetical protein ABR578_07435 [Chromatocurvus sp.]
MTACESEPGRVVADGFEVDYFHYSQAAISDRAVIIMPPTGGTTFLESRYASRFCQAGFSVYVVSAWTGMSETSVELAIHNRLFGRAQRAIQAITEQAPEALVGLLGTSVGGLHAATAAGHLAGVSATFVIAAGAPVASVIAFTDQKALKTLRERRMEKFGFDSQAAYRDALAQEFHWEPLAFADAARDRPLGMVVVRGDRTVPTLYQEQLREAWQPDVEYSVSGFPVGAHAVGILQAWWFHAQDILDFFVEASDPVQT